MQPTTRRSKRRNVVDGGECVLCFATDCLRNSFSCAGSLRESMSSPPPANQPLPMDVHPSPAALDQIYMVTMSVVLLNLLIAVLSTAHDEVYANAEKEFHLARARLIVQSARSVAHRRPPPPLNLLKVISGVVADTATEVYRLWLHAKR